MKKLIALSLAGLMLAGMPVNAFAEGIIYGGLAITYSDVKPVIIDGITYVPIRDVFEDMGFDVQWYENVKTVELKNDAYVIDLMIESNKLIVFKCKSDFSIRELKNPVKIINGRTMLPLREILESVNYSLEWDAETKTTFITDNNDYESIRYKNKMVSSAELYIGGIEKIPVYKADEDAEVGTLTEEEKAWLDNYFQVINSMQTTSYTVDLDEMTTEEIEPVVTAFFDSKIKQIESVPCPESLEDVSLKARIMLDDNKEMMIKLSEFWQAVKGESEAAQESLLASILLCTAMRNYGNAIKADYALYDFFEQKNVGTEDNFDYDYYYIADIMKNSVSGVNTSV